MIFFLAPSISCLSSSSSMIFYSRVDRTGSREHIQVFYSHNASPDEVQACKEAVSFKIMSHFSFIFIIFQYKKVTSSTEIPIGFTIKYAETVLTKEWDDDRLEFEKKLQQIVNSQGRTVEVYALIMVAVKYIYINNKSVFEQLGHTWEEMENEFLPGIFRDFVRQCHPDISRPDLVLKTYLRDVAKILGGLSISEVCFCQAQSSPSSSSAGRLS